MELDRLDVLRITPVAPEASIGVLTIQADTITSGSTVTVGSVVYEFCTAAAASGNKAVTVAIVSATVGSAIVALAAAMCATGLVVTATTSTTTGVLTVTSLTGGDAGEWVVSVSGFSASWGDSTLTGGTDGTIAAKGTLAVDTTYLYWCAADNPGSGEYWHRIAGSAMTILT